MKLSEIATRTGEVIRHVFTGADNRTTAIGRVASVPYLGVSGALPFFMAHHGMSFSLADAAVYFPAVAAGFAGLVRGTSGTEPGA